MIDQILAYNKEFVANRGYEQYVTDKYPDKKLVVLSCMAARLILATGSKASRTRPNRCVGPSTPSAPTRLCRRTSPCGALS